MFYQGGPIDHYTNVTGPVSQSSSGSEYNAACPAGIYLAHLGMINNELLNKDPDVVPEQAPLIILVRKSAICVDGNIKDTKHTRHIFRRIHLLINGEECNLQKTVWFEGGLKLGDIGTNNVRKDDFNTILKVNTLL